MPRGTDAWGTFGTLFSTAVEGLVRLLLALLELVDLLLERLHLRERLGRGLALDRGQLVAAPALLLERRDGVPALAVERDVRVEPGVAEALRHLREQTLGVFAQVLAW